MSKLMSFLFAVVRSIFGIAWVIVAYIFSCVMMVVPLLIGLFVIAALIGSC